jgi:hypothetical protein
VIKVLYFSFLQAKDCTCTFLYFGSECISLVISIQTPDILVQDVPRSVGIAIHKKIVLK